MVSLILAILLAATNNNDNNNSINNIHDPACPQWLSGLDHC